jgi:hypothetical protein
MCTLQYQASRHSSTTDTYQLRACSASSVHRPCLLVYVPPSKNSLQRMLLVASASTVHLKQFILPFWSWVRLSRYWFSPVFASVVQGPWYTCTHTPACRQSNRYQNACMSGQIKSIIDYWVSKFCCFCLLRPRNGFFSSKLYMLITRKLYNCLHWIH